MQPLILLLVDFEDAVFEACQCVFDCTVVGLLVIVRIETNLNMNKVDLLGFEEALRPLQNACFVALDIDLEDDIFCRRELLATSSSVVL